MSAAGGERDRRLGRWLVAAQFALIGLLAWLALPAFLRAQAGVAAWGALAAVGVLGAWTLRANRPGNFNVHPEPRAGGRLVTHGPYRWIRHPMYTTVLLGALAALLAAPGPASALAAVALAGVLTAKARLEERWMRAVHPGYATYEARSGRFLPGL